MSQTNASSNSSQQASQRSYRVNQGYDDPALQFFQTEKGRIAYRKVNGNTINAPQILYMNGFFASMDLSKTVVIEQYARLNGYTNVR